MKNVEISLMKHNITIRVGEILLMKHNITIRVDEISLMKQHYYPGGQSIIK
jgi:hypothetical protein